jgi:pimeloyl-ACP methyl ester carboxylesterase
MPNAVLLVHGFASSYQHGWADDGWPEILADEGLEVIGGDLLGHGSSPKPTDPSAYQNLEESVLQTFQDRRQVDAIGFSLGSRILLTLASREPDRFGRLVLMGIGDNVFDEHQGEELAEVLENGTDPENVGMRVFDRMAADPRNDRAALAAVMRRPAPILDEAALGQVSCPVLLVLGEQDFVGPAERLVAALPDARLRIVSGVDHFATPKAFDAIDAAVRFLTVDSVASST